MTPQWHHSPAHLFVPGMTYIVTGGTLGKKHLFKGHERLQYLQDILLDTLAKHGWIIQAWAVFVNHYHFIARAPEKIKCRLDALIQEFHSVTAREVNRLDGAEGRQVWFQYWDTCITFEKSWLARINYVNSNAVHHKLVHIAADYPYCSAAWLEQKAGLTFSRKVKSFRFDKLKIYDDF